LALTSPTSGGRSVGIVRWRTEASEFFYRKYKTQEIYQALTQKENKIVFKCGDVFVSK
jgi:hypothetical protein